jgi:hypothetical protein
VEAKGIDSQTDGWEPLPRKAFRVHQFVEKLRMRVDNVDEFRAARRWILHCKNLARRTKLSSVNDPEERSVLLLANGS